MLTAYNQFLSNVTRIRDLGSLFVAIDKITTAAIDASDILRAQIVLIVSALDQYIHEITRVGIVEIFIGARARTSAFDKFQISIKSAFDHANGVPPEKWLDDEVRRKHSFLAFQHPDKIADAIRIISDIQLWKDVSRDLHIDSKKLKDRLSLIVQRRNKIAHEADIDPSYPDTRWPISPADVNDSVDFICKICKSISSKVIVP